MYHHPLTPWLRREREEEEAASGKVKAAAVDDQDGPEEKEEPSDLVDRRVSGEDDNGNDDAGLSVFSESDAISEGPAAPEAREAAAFEIPNENTANSLQRDEDGIPIFNNHDFVKCRESLMTMLDKMTSALGPVLAVKHPLCVNITGNIAIVDKVEAEHKEKFLFGLPKADRKLFWIKKGPISVQDNAAAGEKGDNDDGDEDGTSVNKDIASIETAGGGGEASVASGATNETRSEILANTSTQANVPEDERVPLYCAQLDAVIDRLKNMGLHEGHHWIRKFQKYRSQEVKAPSEMSIAKERTKEAAKLKKAGMYGLADTKYDEAITCQLEFLGKLKAASDPEVGAVLYSKAENARVQCSYDRANKLYLQSYAIFLRAQGADSEGCLKCKHGQGEILLSRGLVDQAKMLFEDILRARTRHYTIPGKFIRQGVPMTRDHPCLAQSYHSLAQVALFNGNLTLAHDYATQAMESMRRMERDIPKNYHVDDYGNCPDIGITLAKVAIEKGDFKDAENFLKEAKAIRVDVEACGSDHPDNAKDMIASAILFCRQDKFHDARKLVGKAMRMRLKYLAS